jgi:hypothetical protein
MRMKERPTHHIGIRNSLRRVLPIHGTFNYRYGPMLNRFPSCLTLPLPMILIPPACVYIGGLLVTAASHEPEGSIAVGME